LIQIKGYRIAAAETDAEWRTDIRVGMGILGLADAGYVLKTAGFNIGTRHTGKDEGVNA
jgi:hypothetical protein